jgi:hypothetical protein
MENQQDKQCNGWLGYPEADTTSIGYMCYDPIESGNFPRHVKRAASNLEPTTRIERM